MLIRRPADYRPSEITPPEVYSDRRRFLAAALGLAATAALPAASAATPTGTPLGARRNVQLSTAESPNSWDDVTGYNNYYEFGTDKADPAANAGRLRTNPWSVTIAGEAEVRGTFALEDLIRPHPLEERVYRLRCVEGWSMVVPWVGVPLADLIRRFEPEPRARFVELTTLLDPTRMPGQRDPILQWPYVEGLRLDEAMHPLTILAVGLYGRVLPNQNGAPLRLVVPWKYGFKSIKSIVRMRFVESQPVNAWQRYAPREYGFYSNVNPDVDHPRWSQATERRIGDFFKRKTLMFNGYGDQVASLYAGMDLRRDF
jgi:sulfoxide reductase catalytic subunit YedY